MLTILAGFNTPELMIPLGLLMATALSLIYWLIWTAIQIAKRNRNHWYLLLKLLIASPNIFLAVYSVAEEINHL